MNFGRWLAVHNFTQIPYYAGSLESANSSILAARNLFKDFGGEKNQDFMIALGVGSRESGQSNQVGSVQSADLFTSDIILWRHNFASQHMKQRRDVIFLKAKISFNICRIFSDFFRLRFRLVWTSP